MFFKFSVISINVSLSRLQPQLAKKYLKWCILSHMDATGKVDPVPDYGIRVGSDAFFTASSVPLYLVWDLDKTLTAEDGNTVYEEYNDISCSLNPKIEREHQTLEECIKEIDNSPADFRKPLEKYNKLLRKCGFNTEQHREASIRTGESKNVKIIPYAYDVVLEQQKLNCLPGMNTGSPKDAAVEVSKRKIGISKDLIEGSVGEFDRHGNFIRFILNLGTNKAVSMSNFYHREPFNCYCDCSFVAEPELGRKVYVTDDLEFDKYAIAKIGSQLGVVLYVGEESIVEMYKRPGEFIINAPEIREDARKIRPYLNLYRRAKIFARLHSPREAKSILDCANEIKKLKRAPMDKSVITQLEDRISKFISLESLFPVLTTRFNRKFAEFDDEISQESIDFEAVKRSANSLTEILERNDPIFHTKEEREMQLNEIIAQI